MPRPDFLWGPFEGSRAPCSPRGPGHSGTPAATEKVGAPVTKAPTFSGFGVEFQTPQGRAAKALTFFVGVFFHNSVACCLFRVPRPRCNSVINFGKRFAGTQRACMQPRGEPGHLESGAPTPSPDLIPCPAHLCDRLSRVALLTKDIFLSGAPPLS